MFKKIILLFVLLLTGCVAVDTPKQTVSYHRTIDGDTIELVISGKVEKVRLLLIDTPEKASSNTKEQPYAQEAKKRTKELLTQSKDISISFEKTQRTDKYGRILAYVFIDGQLVQDILVREGYARVAYYRGNERYYRQLQTSEVYARDSRKNIWSIDGYVTQNGYNLK